MMQMTQRLLLAVTLALLLPALALAYGAASDVLDQSQTVFTTNTAIFGGSTQVGQIFTAGKSGYLDRVSVYLENFNSGPATDDITVRIYAYTGISSTPLGTLTGSGTIPASTIPLFGAARWVDVDIDGAFVVETTPYVLVLSSATGAVYWYVADDGTHYTGGEMLYNDGGWVPFPYDTAFKTYVVPDILDQSQDQISGTGSGYRQLTSTPVGQTFTASQSGRLDRVHVFLGNQSISPASGPITLTIRAVSNGLPTNTQITSGTIPLAAIPQPGTYAWVSASLTPVIVTAGTTYALLLSSGGGTPLWSFVGDVYPAGTRVIRSGTSWSKDSSHDFAFDTYVLPPILDQQQTVSGEFSNFFGDYFGSYRQAGQIFTPHVSGQLDRVSVLLAMPLCPPWCSLGNGSDDVIVSIVPVTAGGIPDDVPIGTATIPISSVPTGGTGTSAWLSASFSGVDLQAGIRYAIVLDEPGSGVVDWRESGTNTYAEGYLLFADEGWRVRTYDDEAFQTYVIPAPLLPATAEYGITPCVNDVCPTASASITPANLGDHVTSHVQFQERPEGSVQGSLTFSDSNDGGIRLQGCTTHSAACRVTVTTFACTAEHAITIAGTYTPKGASEDYGYTLTLSGVADGPGTFSLTSGTYTYTLTQDGIVDVTCPPGAGLADLSG